MARTQVYRVVDALLESQAHFSFAWKDVDLLPHGTLPPSAMIFAFSPLVDRRATDAIKNLFARGFPLVVIDTLPEERVAADPGPEGELARRVWLLERADAPLRARVDRYPGPEVVGGRSSRRRLCSSLPRVPTRADRAV